MRTMRRTKDDIESLYPETSSTADALGQCVDDVVARMVAGEGEALLNKLTALLQPIHSYSIGNLILQYVQAPESKLIASKQAFADIAKEQGHEPADVHGKQQYIKLNAGCKGVAILRPQIRKVKVTEEDEETGEEIERYAPRTIGFTHAYTWRAEDIRYADTEEPFDVPDMRCPVENEGLFKALLDFCDENEIEVTEENLLRAHGQSRMGEIALDKRDSWEKQVKTLIHEVAHELLHDTQARKIKEAHAVREAEAELTAAILMDYFGYDTDYSLAYLQNYVKDPKLILKLASRPVKVAGRLIEYLGLPEPQEAAETSAA